MITHEQAMEKAGEAYMTGYPLWEPSFEAAMRAYIEDRDLVLVPRKPTADQKEAACKVGPDTQCGGFDYDDADNVYCAMISAAPDQFEDTP